MCVLEFANEMLGPNGQLNLALCEYDTYYPDYGLEGALQKFGGRFKFDEKYLMSEKYKDYRHVSSLGSDAAIKEILTLGFEHIYAIKDK